MGAHPTGSPLTGWTPRQPCAAVPVTPRLARCPGFGRTAGPIPVPVSLASATDPLTPIPVLPASVVTVVVPT